MVGRERREEGMSGSNGESSTHFILKYRLKEFIE